MEVANYRTISILDKDGLVFERIWCIFELHLALIKVQEKRGNGVHLDWNGLWAVYTAHEHIYREGKKDEEIRRAVGLCREEVLFLIRPPLILPIANEISPRIAFY